MHIYPKREVLVPASAFSALSSFPSLFYFLKDIFGIYHDPKGYFVAHENPEDFEKYDLQFPKKEKLKLPGHIF